MYKSKETLSKSLQTFGMRVNSNHCPSYTLLRWHAKQTTMTQSVLPESDYLLLSERQSSQFGFTN